MELPTIRLDGGSPNSHGMAWLILVAGIAVIFFACYLVGLVATGATVALGFVITVFVFGIVLVFVAAGTKAQIGGG